MPDSSVVILDSRPNTVAELPTTRIPIVDGSGNPVTGKILEVVWAEADQSAANLVHLEFASGAGAFGSHVVDLHPGPSFTRYYSIAGCGPVGIGGSSEFAVSVRVHR